MRARAGRRLLAVAVTLTALLGLSGLSAAPSSALVLNTYLGNLGVSGGSGPTTTGTVTDPYSLTAAVACPANDGGSPPIVTNRFIARMTGPGWTNVNLMGPTAVSGPVSAPIADTFVGLAASNSLSIPNGTYLVTGQCQNNVGTAVSGKFYTRMVFSGSGQATTWALQAIPEEATTTTLSGPSTSPAGSNLTLTATIAKVSPPGTATLAGTVQFKDGTTNLGSPVAINGSGQAQLVTNALAVGPHSITAVFTADNGANPINGGPPVSVSPQVTGSTSAAKPVTITGAATTTSLGVSPTSPVIFGTNVILTATVSPSGAAGSVEFFDGATSLGSAAVSAGQAQVSTSTLSVGSHALTATFTPTDPNVWASSTTASPTSYTIDPTPATQTTTTISSVTPPSPATYGATVTINATVTPSNALGAVQFYDGATPLGTPRPVSGGAASLQTSALGAGPHSFTASFAPTNPADFTPSTTASSTAYTVSAQPTTTTISNVSPPSPVIAGTNVTITATVSPSTAAGSVQFFDGATSLGSGTVSAGTAQVSTTTLPVGTRSLTATFTPTNSTLFGGSSTASPTSYVVNPDLSVATTTSISSVTPPSPAAYGATVTITAAVTPGNAVGSVQFFDGATSLGSTAVSGGTAAVQTSSLGSGPHSFTATFTPANPADFKPSTTASATPYTVSARPTTTTISSITPPTSAPLGTNVAITATVTPSSAAGSVQFFDGATSLGSQSVSSGTATLNTTALALGQRSITATFTPTNATLFATSSTTGPTSYEITPAVTKTTSTALVVTPSGTTTTAVGQTLRLTATVKTTNPDVAVGAVGSIQFRATPSGGSATALGGPVPLASDGTATLSWSQLAAGDYTLTAEFVPTDPNAYAGSTSPGVLRSVIVAPQLGTLRFFVTANPGNDFGLATDPMSLGSVSANSPKGCRPLGTATMNIRAAVSGPGGWASGITAIGTRARPSSVGSDFDEPLADTMAGLAASNSISIVAGKYDFRLECIQNSGVVGYFAGSIWFTDTVNWQSKDPNSSATVTTTAISASPIGWQFTGKPVTLTATVSPATAVGTVQFKNTDAGATSDVGSAVTVIAGVATLTKSDLPPALYTFSAVFVPADAAKFATSTSSTLTYYVRKMEPPINTVAPAISGTPAVGKTLTCSPGNWANSPTSIAYAWLRNGYPIPDAITAKHVVTTSDAGSVIACRVLATNDGGTTWANSTGAKVPLLAASVPVRGKGPKIAVLSRVRGAKAVVGGSLVALPGTWTPRPRTFGYQWRINGKAVKGATKATFRLPKSAKGKRVSCTVIAYRAGARNGVATTSAVVVR